MNNVNQTLYIPLCGKALVSRRGIILSDPDAERIWAEEGYPLHGKAASKWLAYYMGMRSAVYDRWVTEQLTRYPEAVVLHLGCGMDSRANRVGRGAGLWFDVDFQAVISERRRYFRETECYRMLPGDLRNPYWLDAVPGREAIVIMEGVSMYLKPRELTDLLKKLTGRFDSLTLMLDCYTPMAAKLSAYRNPINDVGVTEVYGLSDPHILTEGTGLTYTGEHTITPEDLIAQLGKWEQKIFRKLYAGTVSHKLYRLYSFASFIKT